MKQRNFNKFLKTIIMIILSGSILACNFLINAENSIVNVKTSQINNSLVKTDLPNYQDYKIAHKTDDYPKNEISLKATDSDCKTVQFKDITALDFTTGKSEASWWLSVSETGNYRIRIRYFPVEGKSKPIQLSLKIDNSLQFSECDSLTFGRVWVNNTDIFRTDNAGNQIRPTQVEQPGWLSEDMADRDETGDIYEFYIQQGEHKLSIESEESEFYIADLTLYNPDLVESYDISGPTKSEVSSTQSYSRLWQAELASRKSDAILYPITDRSSPLTTPYDAIKTQLNTIGGTNWSTVGQWIEWDIEVPFDGYYKLTLRERQNVMRGLKSYRRLLIDGAVPYRECETYAFDYNSKWQVEEIGNGNEPYYFYLTKGNHTIRMEAVLGEIEYTVSVLQQSLSDLNTLYRQIVMITGTVPDTLRDYSLDTQISNLDSTLRSNAKLLTDEITRIEGITGSNGSEASSLHQFAQQLLSFAEQPETIPSRLSNYKTNISALSTLLLNLHKQPLELDYIMVSTPGCTIPRANANFYEKLKHEFKTFIFSFVNDYSSVGKGESENRTLNVWLTMGRDQAQIVRTICDDLFQPQYNIGVNLSLVQGSITEPVMAGRGPDIVIGIGRSLVTDMAARGVLYPLNNFNGLQQVKQQFQSSATVPYMYNGQLYALPETQEFNMMFLRTDVYNELGLKAPVTWDDIRRQAGIIQQNNLNMGLVNGVHSSTTTALNSGLPSILTSLLSQNNMQYYKKDLSASIFDTPEAVEVYKYFTSFFTDYSFTVYFDAINQFRTGEMPLIIAPLSTYNSLYISAPEIRGLWNMLPIPGTENSNGLDISEDGMGTGTLIFNSCQNPQDAWKFLQFWSSAEVQSRFSRELETLLGAGARYMTANTEAFYNLSWSKSEIKEIHLQRDAIKEFPQVPGNYILTRNLTNAFVEVMDGKNVRETLLKYANIINKELERKHDEFGYKYGDDYYE